MAKKPHLRTSIEYLHAIFEYLERTGITMYRISSDIAPYLTHPEKPEFRNQIMRQMSDLVFDVMLEAKMKDQALLRLQRDLLRCAPEIAQRFRVTASTGRPNGQREGKASASKNTQVDRSGSGFRLSHWGSKRNVTGQAGQSRTPNK